MKQIWSELYFNLKWFKAEGLINRKGWLIILILKQINWKLMADGHKQCIMKELDILSLCVLF